MYQAFVDEAVIMEGRYRRSRCTRHFQTLSSSIVENTQVGPFLILERLGNRRQRVYRARQTEQNVEVALKFLGMPDEAMRATAIAKIQLEVDVLKRLHHPNLVQLLGAGLEGDQIFFASELIDGESLTSALTRRGKFAADQVIDYGRQIAQLLDYLHKQDIIHSKLTPDKILITSDDVIKVADLRLNRSRRRRWDSAKKREMDIAAYMAPEQFSEGATDKSDVYSLGIILYEMLTGKLPYELDTMGRMARKKMELQAPSVAEQVLNCPVWLDRLVAQMIDPDPRKRPHSTRAVVMAFEELKRVDQSRTSSVSQVSGGFNALTAGADKSEADRLLGKKKPKESGASVFQSVWFLVGGLTLIAGILIFAMLPVSSQKHFDRAEALMRSEDSGSWINAREYLQQIIDRGSEDPFFNEAEALYFESRRRTLVMQAEQGRVMAMQSRHSQRFSVGIELLEQGKLESARDVFAGLVDSVDPQGDERHIHIESTARLNWIAEQLPEESEQTDVDEAVTAEQVRNAVTREEIELLLARLVRLEAALTDDADWTGTLQELDAFRSELNDKLKKLQEKRDNSDH